MAHLLAQHSFQGASGKPEDRFVNTFHFEVGEPVTTTQLALIADSVMGFYSDPASGLSNPVTNWLSGWIDTEDRVVKIYDQSDPKPRAPIYELVEAPAGPYGTGTNLPPEVAVCLSYQAAPSSGIPIARRRGRIYIGPLSTGAVFTGSLSTNSEPITDFQVALCAAAFNLQAACSAGGAIWSVYSTMQTTTYPIVKAWVDNAWDTQRRRGIDSTSRTTRIFADG